jgi:hypothetical protein
MIGELSNVGVASAVLAEDVYSALAVKGKS